MVELGTAAAAAPRYSARIPHGTRYPYHRCGIPPCIPFAELLPLSARPSEHNTQGPRLCEASNHAAERKW
jgi:hypothetical protein